MPVNLLCPFYWEDDYYVTFCKSPDAFLAQDIVYAVSLSSYIIAAIGHPNTDFVASETLTSSCNLSAHIGLKGHREESGMMKMSYLIRKANKKDQMSKNDPGEVCMVIH